MLTKSRKTLFESLDSQITLSIDRIECESIQLARSLREMAQERDDGKPLWSEGGFSSLKAYCKDRSIGKTRFRELMYTGEVVERIESENRQNDRSLPIPSNAGSVQPMYTLSTNNPEAIPQVWDYAIEVAAEDDCDQPEQRHVQEAMREYNAKGGNLESKRRRYSERERQLKSECEEGWAVVANINKDHALISWAEKNGKYVYVGRGSKWGNPFKLVEDGDRATVCRCYEKHYVPNKPSILGDVASLAGKVLGCYCSPEQCHADTLAGIANGEWE